ncbi:MAG TPA: DUF4402 domain-containing protein [Longimicrobiales bacterium]|nr:DUF4402 domain-containing protein [Longimicrobiales bacterium]
MPIRIPTVARRFFFVVAAWAIVAGVPQAAAAQIGGPLEPALSVERLADLSFGTVLTGDWVLVAPADPTAAQFSITAPRNATVFISLELPANLQGGLSTLPVTFGAADGEWSAQDRPVGRTAFDPRQGTQIVVPNTGRVFVWIGGGASIPPTQPSGAYRGAITMTVVVN